MPTENQRKAITNFFDSIKILEQQNVIKSTRFSGDIAEFLCEKIFNLTPNTNLRAVGFDAIDVNNNKIQIKINNSKTKTNQTIGNKNKFDYLYLIVTSNSFLFDKKINNPDAFILIYIIPKDELPAKKYIAKKEINNLKPTLFLDKNLQVMKF